jgi:hypothetical protein
MMIAKSSPAPRRIAALVLAVASTMAVASTAVAQQASGMEDEFAVQAPTTWFTLPVRTGILVALLIVAWACGFYAIFPWLLERKQAMRPLQAYGLSAGLIWAAWCGAALLVFQDMLVLNWSIEGPGGGFARDWLLTCLIGLAGLVGFVALRMIFGGRGAQA